MGEDFLVTAAGTGTGHDHHDIRLGLDDRLVGQRLVAVERAFRRVDRAGKPDDAVGRRVAAGRHDPAVLEGKDEQHALAFGFRPLGCVGNRGVEIGADLRFEFLRLVFHAEEFADDVDLLEDRRAVVTFRHGLEGNAGAFQHGERIRRAAAFDGEDRGRVDGDDALRRELAHVADVGKLGCLLREGAGGIAGDQPAAFAERIDDFRHSTADRHELGAVDLLHVLGHRFADEAAGAGRGERQEQRGGEGEDGQRHFPRAGAAEIEALAHGTCPFYAATLSGRGRLSRISRQSARSVMPSFRLPKNWMIISPLAS